MGTAIRLISSSSGPDDGVLKGGSRLNAGNGSKRRWTILIVEDDILIRLSIGDYLRDHDYRVIEAASASEAKAVLQAGAPVELVFSDIEMPGEMNGFELARWIRENFPGLPVLLTSGLGELPNARGYAEEHGPVLSKPYSYERVHELIGQLVQRQE